MKKYLVLLTVFALIGVVGYVGYAADSSSVAKPTAVAIPDRFLGTVGLSGKTPRTVPVNIDNVARTVSAIVVAGGSTYLGGSDNTLTPIALTISCPDNATRWAFNLTPSATVGHKLPGDSSWQISGPDAIGALKGIANGATDNNSCTFTLWY